MNGLRNLNETTATVPLLKLGVPLAQGRLLAQELPSAAAAAAAAAAVIAAVIAIAAVVAIAALRGHRLSLFDTGFRREANSVKGGSDGAPACGESHRREFNHKA